MNRRRPGGASVSLIQLLFVLLASCRPASIDLQTSRDGAADEPRAPVASLFSTEKQTYDFGLLEHGDNAKHCFELRSSSTASVRLSLGRASCGCLSARLFPNKFLAPGASGSLTLELNTKNENAVGRVLEYIIVTATSERHGGGEETCRFALEAFFNGVRPASTSYVVRGELAEGRVQPLELIVCSSERETGFELESITSTIGGMFPVPEMATVDEPVARDGYYQQRIFVPIKIVGPLQQGKGRFDVRYSLLGSERDLSVEVFVLATPTGIKR